MPLDAGSPANQSVGHFWAPPAHLALSWKVEDVGRGMGRSVSPRGLRFL